MLSNPNMSLTEFASRFGLELKPHHKEFNKSFERGERVVIDQPRHRTLSDGRVKDTCTGEVHEPFTSHISDYTGDRY